MNHLNSHNGYSCKLCTRVFKSYDQLRYHKETHVKTKDFVCDFKDCKKAFATKRRMHAHRRLHLSEDFVCEICGSRQRNKQALRDHIRKHSGEKPFACSLCDRRFASNSLLNEHKACHETERKHVCDVCGKSFNRPKALYHHKPLHLGVKKFVCKLCGAAYAQAAGLSAHMRKHKEEKINADSYAAVGNIFNVLFPGANN